MERKTISQVAELTGISTRTLQYYDEINLLKPAEVTSAGYRLYDEGNLQTLQQILFFKELGFRLKEISEILQKSDLDRIAVFQKQKELLLLKRNRMDRLIALLDRLAKGESCMSFQEFDLSDYIHALEDFKCTNAAQVIRHWGSTENFDLFIQKIKEDSAKVAKLAISQFGSIEAYTDAMKYNLEHFSELMEAACNEDIKEIGVQSDLLYAQLTADLSKAVSCPEIQEIVRNIDLLITKTSAFSLGMPSLDVVIDAYSSDYITAVTDTKYGAGASVYITQALRYYLKHKEK